jgi:hypothetical protein
MFSTLTVRIHSKLAAKCPVAIKLWYFCRALSNSGRAYFNVKQVSELFQCSVRTIRSWLSQGIKEGYYRVVLHDNKGNYTVYYSSLFALSKDWGYVTEISVSELLNIREIATEVTAIGLQKRARVAARYHRAKEKVPFQRKVNKADRYLDNLSSPSRLKALGVLDVNDRYLFTDRNFTPYGTSHKSISRFLGRSTASVQRNLRNINKRQLAQHKEEYLIERLIQIEEEGNDDKYFYHRFHISSNKEVSKVRLFKALNNLYSEDRVIFSMRKSKLLAAEFPRSCCLLEGVKGGSRL